jgi:hypothetical protein
MRIAIPVILMLAAAAQLQGQTPDSAQRRDTVYAAVPALGQAEPSALEGVLAGREAARGQRHGGPFTGGLIAGFLFPVLGNAVAYGITASSTPGIPIEQQTALQAFPTEYRMAYVDAYVREAKARRKQASLMGGLLGSGALVVLFLFTLEQGH